MLMPKGSGIAISGFLFFLKKVTKKFAQNKNLPYICTRNQG